MAVGYCAKAQSVTLTPTNQQLDGKSQLNFKTNSSTRLTILDNGNVGIGTTTPDAKLDINGDIKLEQRYLLANGGGTITYDALDRQNKSLVYMPMQVGTNVVIKGISAPSTPASGYGTMLFLQFTGVSTITIEHNTATISTNSIFTNTGSSITITGSGGVVLVYTDGKWYVLSYAP
jgi:hypothetical protein